MTSEFFAKHPSVKSSEVLLVALRFFAKHLNIHIRIRWAMDTRRIAENMLRLKKLGYSVYWFTSGMIEFELQFKL